MSDNKTDVRMPLRFSVICHGGLHTHCGLEGCRCSCHEVYESQIVGEYAYSAICKTVIQMMFSNREANEEDSTVMPLSNEDIEFMVRFANTSSRGPLPEDTLTAAVYAAQRAVPKPYWSLSEFEHDLFTFRDGE